MRLLVIALVIAASGSSVLAGPTAEELYGEGQRAYDRGEYATAIAKWQRSYVLSDETGLLYNIAQAHRLRGDCTAALATYKRFIELDPKSVKRALAADFIDELEPTCGASVSTQASDVERPRATPGRTMKLAGLATSGGGVLVLVTGVAFGYRASVLGDEVTRACAVSICDWAEQKDKDAAGRRDAAIGYTLDVIGVAAILGGATMYYLGDREGSISVSPRARDGGAIVSWSGSW